MAITATNEGGSNIPMIEPDTYQARCVQMIHIGTIEDEYQGRKKMSNLIRLVFELPTELYEFKEGEGEKPRIIAAEVTLSLSEKANLRKYLEAWRGKPFTEEELAGFDVTNVIGAPCVLSIVSKVSAKGKTYAKIESIAKEMKGSKTPDQVTPSLIFQYDDPVEVIEEKFIQLPPFIQDKIVTSQEWAALGIDRPQVETTEAPPQDEVSEAAAEAGEAGAESAGDPPPF